MEFGIASVYGSRRNLAVGSAIETINNEDKITKEQGMQCASVSARIWADVKKVVPKSMGCEVNDAMFVMLWVDNNDAWKTL